MDRRRNGLGIIAIALGALALVVALVGQIGPRVSVQVGDDDDAPRFEERSAQVEPTPAPNNRNRYEDDSPEHMFGKARGEHGPFGRGDHDFGSGFFPFMILGGLLKLGAALALIMLGLRLFRGGRGGWGGRGGRGGNWRGRPQAQVYEPMPGDRRREPLHTSDNSYL